MEMPSKNRVNSGEPQQWAILSQDYFVNRYGIIKSTKGKIPLKITNGKVQRPVRQDVGLSSPKRTTPRTGDDMVCSHR